MRAKGKKLADAAGRLGSAKENYHTPQSYKNNPMLSNLFYKPKFTRKFRRKGKYYYANTGT